MRGFLELLWPDADDVAAAGCALTDRRDIDAVLDRVLVDRRSWRIDWRGTRRTRPAAGQRFEGPRCDGVYTCRGLALRCDKDGDFALNGFWSSRRMGEGWSVSGSDCPLVLRTGRWVMRGSVSGATMDLMVELCEHCEYGLTPVAEGRLVLQFRAGFGHIDPEPADPGGARGTDVCTPCRV